jgi:isopenicillin-N N-acyltransferase-like protein
MGVNECGIGLVENGLASSHDGRHPYRKPFHVRCREVLDAETFDDAARTVTDTPRTCSANFVIGQAATNKAGGKIVDLEWSPDHVSRIAPVDGIVTHSNHFLTSGHGESLLEKAAPNTLHRVDRMRALLQRHRGAIDLAQMRAATTDHAGAPYAICRHPDPKQPDAKRTMTAGAVLIDLDARVMHAANGPPCENDYVAFTL